MKGGDVMKKFEMPAMEIEKLEIMDVISTSNECYCDGYNADCEWEG